jgi:hypothetical protein
MVGRKKTKRTKRGGDGYDPKTKLSKEKLLEFFNHLNGTDNHGLHTDAKKKDIISAIDNDQSSLRMTPSQKDSMKKYVDQILSGVNENENENFEFLKSTLNSSPSHTIHRANAVMYHNPSSLNLEELGLQSTDDTNVGFKSVGPAAEGGKRRRRRHTKKHKKSKKSQKRRGKKTQRRRG